MGKHNPRMSCPFLIDVPLARPIEPGTDPGIGLLTKTIAGIRWHVLPILAFLDKRG
jgi:hypothetical protein